MAEWVIPTPTTLQFDTASIFSFLGLNGIYHSESHQCHPGSPSPRHTRMFPAGSGFCCHTDECSRQTSSSLPHQTDPDTGLAHHTTGSCQCTSCHGHTETDLQKTKINKCKAMVQLSWIFT